MAVAVNLLLRHLSELIDWSDIMSALREKPSSNSANVVLQPFFCCTILESMQKDVLLLKREFVKLVPLKEQHKEYLNEFFQLTQLVDTKLCALWSAAHKLELAKITKAKEFVQNITIVWKSGNEEARKVMNNTQLVSQNYPDIPLEEFIQTTWRHYCGLKKHFDYAPQHTRCNQIALSKTAEIINYFNHLSCMDGILEYYIGLHQINTLLRNIVQVIDDFIIQEGFFVAMYGPSFVEKVQPGANLWKIPTSGPNGISKQMSELSALTKLLTGELIGHEPLDAQTGLKPVVTDSNLEIYLVPSTSVKSCDKSLIGKNIFDIYQPGVSTRIINVKMPDVAEKNAALDFTKEALSGKENIATRERIIHTIKLPYKGSNAHWKNRKQKFRDVIGSAVDADLQPIKIPCIEGALLPPLP